MAHILKAIINMESNHLNGIMSKTIMAVLLMMMDLMGLVNMDGYFNHQLKLITNFIKELKIKNRL